MKKSYKVSILIGIIIIFIAVILLQRETTRVGAVLPLTGGLASVGEDIRNGMQIAMDETGLEINIQDGEANPQKSLNAARQLVDIEKAKIVLTAFRGASLSIASGLQDKNAVIFSTTATAEGKSVSTSTPNLFVMGSEIVKSAEILGRYAKQNNICKAVGLMSEQTDVGKDKLKGFSSSLGAEKIAITEFFDPAATDFRTIIAKIKGTGADCIFVEIRSNTFSVLLKQLEENNYDAKVFSTSYSVTPAVFKEAPKKQLDNVIFSSTLIDEGNPLTKSFLEKYKARYNRDATDFSLVGYEMVKMIEQPVKRCGEDIDCIKNYLGSISDRDTVLGNLTMGENQEIPLKDYNLFRVVDGKFVELK